MHPEQTLAHAQGQGVAFVLVNQFTHMNRRGKLHAGLAAQNQDADQTPQAPGDCPAVGK